MTVRPRLIIVRCKKPDLSEHFVQRAEGSCQIERLGHRDRFPRQVALDHALQSVDRILKAERKSKGKLLYAENWVYAPSIQKEREIIEKMPSRPFTAPTSPLRDKEPRSLSRTF